MVVISGYFIKSFYLELETQVIFMGAETREERIDEERSLEEKEQKEEEEKGENPELYRPMDQDTVGAEVEEYTNLVKSYRHALEKLDHLINTLKSSISEEDKAEVEEQIIDARKDVIAAKKRLDDYRTRLGDAAPSSEGETIDALDHQFDIAMADTEEIAKKKEE